MTIRVSRSAAALVSTWFALVGVLVSLLFWARWFLPALLCAAVWCFVCMVFGTLFLSSFRVFAGHHHLSVRYGFLFTCKHRVPRRFVTGCFLLTSPLQRRMGSCVLVILSSGGFFVVPGAPLSAAETLTAQLQSDGLTARQNSPPTGSAG